MTFCFPDDLTVPEPVSGDEIAWMLIRLGMDAGLEGPEIARFLLRLDGFPLWPDHESIAVYLADAGL